MESDASVALEVLLDALLLVLLEDWLDVLLLVLLLPLALVALDAFVALVELFLLVLL